MHYMYSIKFYILCIIVPNLKINLNGFTLNNNKKMLHKVFKKYSPYWKLLILLFEFVK